MGRRGPLRLALALVLLAGAACGCGSGGGAPVETVRQFYSALENHDFAVLHRLVSPEAPRTTVLSILGANEIRVFLRDDLTEQELKSIISFSGGIPGVKSVEYISREQALEKFKRTHKDRLDVLGEVEGNPLPAELLITVEDDSDVDAVTGKMGDRPEIAADPHTGDKQILAGLNRLLGKYYKNIRFYDLDYKSSVRGRAATVRTVGGDGRIPGHSRGNRKAAGEAGADGVQTEKEERLLGHNLRGLAVVPTTA